MIKKSILGGAILVVSFLSWFFLNPWIQNPVKISNWDLWLMPLALFIILNCLVVAGFAVTKSKWEKLGVSFIAIAPFFLVYGFNYLLVIAAVLALLLQLYASRSVKLEAREKAEVSFVSIVQHGSPRVITSFLVLISFAYFLTPGVQLSDSSKQINSKIESVVSQVSDSFLSDQLKGLSPQDRQVAEGQVVNETKNRLVSLVEPFANYIPPLLAFGMFLVLQSFSFIWVWLSMLFGMFLFWILRKTDVIKITKTTIEVEQIDF
jgi:hypothetical protein